MFLMYTKIQCVWNFVIMYLKNVNQAFEKMLNKYFKNVNQALEKC